MCLEDRIAVESLEGAFLRPRQRAKQKEGINVLGVITLREISLLEHESNTGRGWVAVCFLYLSNASFLCSRISPGTSPYD
jgi:hypothetical protein